MTYEEFRAYVGSIGLRFSQQIVKDNAEPTGFLTIVWSKDHPPVLATNCQMGETLDVMRVMVERAENGGVLVRATEQKVPS